MICVCYSGIVLADNVKKGGRAMRFESLQNKYVTQCIWFNSWYTKSSAYASLEGQHPDDRVMLLGDV